MTDWKDLSPATLSWMETIGSFGPTTRAEEALLKGSTYDAEIGEHHKTYLDIDDLRNLAAACTEAADWLTRRRAAAAMAGDTPATNGTGEAGK